MKDPYANVSERLWDSEFSVLADEPIINAFDWLYFECMAEEGEKYLGSRMIDHEGVF